MALRSLGRKPIRLGCESSSPLQCSPVRCKALLGRQPRSLTPEPATKDDRVDRDVRCDETTGKKGLEPVGQGCRVDDWNDVVLDEAARVAGPAGRVAQRVLERCERTDASRELDEQAPADGW